MKLFKKAVSLFLALLMIFGSVSLLATASGNEIFHWIEVYIIAKRYWL